MRIETIYTYILLSLTYKQTHIMQSIYADRQAGRQTDRQADRQAGRQTDEALPPDLPQPNPPLLISNRQLLRGRRDGYRRNPP